LVLVEVSCEALSLAECGVPAVALVGTASPTWLPQSVAFRRVDIALFADYGGRCAALEGRGLVVLGAASRGLGVGA
jgi:hypothetical protein